MAIPNTGRFAALTIQRHFKRLKADEPGKAVTAELTVVSDGKDKSLKFTGFVTLKADGVQVAKYDVVSDTSGALQKFDSVDLAVKLLAGIIPSNTGLYHVGVNVGTLLDVAPANDLVKAATARKTKLMAQKTKVQAVIVKHDAQLTLMVDWENGNALQAARKAEVLAQKAAMVDLIASIDAEVVILTAQGA